jgi:hypothetical protein
MVLYILIFTGKWNLFCGRSKTTEGHKAAMCWWHKI